MSYVRYPSPLVLRNFNLYKLDSVIFGPPVFTRSLGRARVVTKYILGNFERFERVQELKNSRPARASCTTPDLLLLAGSVLYPELSLCFERKSFVPVQLLRPSRSPRPDEIFFNKENPPSEKNSTSSASKLNNGWLCLNFNSCQSEGNIEANISVNQIRARSGSIRLDPSKRT